MALKSVDDVEVGGFDDELSTTEISYLVRTLETFLGIVIEGQEVRTLLKFLMMSLDVTRMETS